MPMFCPFENGINKPGLSQEKYTVGREHGVASKGLS